MGVMDYLTRAVAWWSGPSWSTQIFTSRKGEKVGEDNEGNVFYQMGARRWVIYNGENEASRVSPEWHGWLHHTWDQPPTEMDLNLKPWQKPHLENLTGTARAYAPKGSIRRVDPVDRSDYEAWSPE